MTKNEQWKSNYEIAVNLFNDKGSISVPVTYVYQDFNIGKWLAAQRSKRNLGSLSDERIALLDKLSFKWEIKDKLYNTYFEKMIVLLNEYIEEFGNSHIPNDCIYHGEKLGEWARNIRNSLRGYYPGKKKLSTNQLKRLEDLGFSSDWYTEKLEKKWNRGYVKLKDFIQARGSNEISTELIFEGFNLGRWVHLQRTAKKEGILSEYRKKLLRDIGFDFSPKDHVWEDAFNLAKKYYEQMGNLDVPSGFVIDGFSLGAWISNQRQVYKGSRTDMVLTQNQIDSLNSIGMIWNARSASNTSFAEQVLCYYFSKIFPDVKNRFLVDGLELDLYIPSERCGIEYDGCHWHNGKLEKDNEKDAKMQELGIRFIRIREKPLCKTQYAHCFFRDTGNTVASLNSVLVDVLENEFSVSIDVNIERDAFEIVSCFPYFSPVSWNSFFLNAKEYFEKNGNLLILHNYITENDIHLGQWISNQRARKRGYAIPPLTTDEIKKLDSIGMVWEVRQEKWEDSFEIAASYYTEFGNLLPKRASVYKGLRIGKWINTQRTAYRKGRMPLDRIKRLELIGMVWNTKIESFF